MKIKSVQHNNRKKAFEVSTAKGNYEFPYAKVRPQPKPGNYVREVYVDKELGNEGFSYILESGKEGSVHLDHVLEYNQDPEYMRDLLLYNLTVAIQERLEKSNVGKRELTRLLGTSAAQVYRLLDPANSRKSIGQMLTVLHLLDCEVQVVVKDKRGKQILECTA